MTQHYGPDYRPDQFALPLPPPMFPEAFAAGQRATRLEELHAAPTEVEAPPVAQTEDRPMHVNANGTTELAALLAQYDTLAAEKAEADRKLKAVTDAIKALVTSHAVQADGKPYQRYLIEARGLAHPVQLTWKTSHTLDTKRLRAEHPDLAAVYTRESGHWDLRAKS